MDDGVIIIDSSKEEIERIKTKWQKTENFGKVLSSVATPTLIITLLSPFDFEGPIAEIVSAVALATGFTLKKVANGKLKELELKKDETLIKNEEKLSDGDKNTIKDFANYTSMVLKKSKDFSKR